MHKIVKGHRRLAAMLVGVLAATGCGNFDQPNISGPEIAGNASRLPVAMGKETSASAITTEAVVLPDSGGQLKINGRNMNEATFFVKGGNVSEPLTMRLVKLSETSNTYHLEPFDMALPAGVAIALDYSHSALPLGVSESNLQVFELENDRYVPLESRVLANKLIVRATAGRTGEFALGAYDEHGELQLIEGEFGLRVDDWVNPRQDNIIRLPGGSMMEIPRGAVNERTLIGMIATRETIRGVSEAKAFTFTPHGTVFNIPIRLTLNWKELAGQPVALYYYNEFTGEWELTASGRWDAASNTVTLEIPHFSRYAISVSQ